MTSSLAFALLLAQAAPVAPAADAWPQWSPDGQHIVFGSTRDGDWEIYVMRADGSQARRLTASPGRDAHPMFLPDGRIVFQSPRGLADANQVDLYLMDADGRNPRRIVADPGFNGVPVPSPDGSRIAFQRSPIPSPGGEYHWDLFVVDSGGRRERRLTANAWSSQVPTWSPDGRRLAFYADPERRNQLFILELGSGEITPLAPSSGADNAPAWSPDGKSIAFVSTRDGPRDLYRVDLARGGVARLTHGMDIWGQPGWSPDGRRLLFSAKTAGVDQIYVIDVTGTGLRRLAEHTCPRSSDILALLPDGEDKRELILDCTGCHQLGEPHVRPAGQWRTEAQWVEAITRMLRYAGATSSFPVISAQRDPQRTAAWLTRHLRGEPPTGRCSPPVAAPQATITEFLLPDAGDLAHDVAVDSQGRVVVTGMFTHRMYVLDPTSDSARFTAVDIPVPSANPRAVEIDRDGDWWVVLGQPRRLARYSPGTGRWQTFDVGVYAHSVALDSSAGGRAWFNGHFTHDPELIGFVDSAGTVTSVAVPPHPTLGAGPGGPIPYEIRVAPPPDGRIWISELTGNRLVGYDPRARTFSTHTLPMTAGGPRRFDVDRGGALWIPAYGANALLRLDPATGRFEAFPLPVRDAVPYVARIDAGTGTIWIGTSAADVLLAFDPRRRHFTVYPLPSRGALVRHLAIDPRTHDVWIAYGASPGIPARIARLSPGEGGSMARTIAGVIVGYLVMAVVVFAIFSLTYIALGADGAFQPGTYAPTAVWIVLSLIFSFLAAWVGGRVAAVIGRGPNAVIALAVVVVVLGVLFAVPVMRRTGEPAVRPGMVDNMEAMRQAQTPLWVALLTPLIGAAGVIVGGRRRVAPPQL